MIKDSITAEEFSYVMADAIREAVPDADVTVVSANELTIATTAGEYRCFLDNTLRDVQAAAEESRLEVVSQRLESLKSMLASQVEDLGVNTADVVPVIKDATWLDQLRELGDSDDPIYREHLAGDIFVVYAEDGEHQLAYLTQSKIKSLRLAGDALRTAALENLSRKLPKVERHGDGPLYLITAGGIFEASLLLMPTVWEGQEAEADGRIVAAVPTRDLLLFTGENSKEALEQMRSAIDEVQANENYLISKTLFVRTRDGWSVLE